MAIEIAHTLLSRLLDLAGASPTHEICGLLFGKAGRISRIEPANNVADNVADAFEIDPSALFAALRAERAGGDHLIGHYHSHPNGQPIPSSRDLAASEPGKIWLIIGVGKARLWMAEKSVFRELQLVVTK